jgi:hypothetical protein
MAQVITRCRLTGHYIFMGMEADPKEFTRSPGPFARKFCPFCACDHLWHKEDSHPGAEGGAAPAHPASELIGWISLPPDAGRSSHEASADGEEIHVPSRTPTPH